MKKDGMHIYKDGDKSWFLNGMIHREDGPAVILATGSKFWYKNSKRHREDGPAVEKANGYKSWFLNGKWHPSFDSWLKELDVSDDDKLFLKLKWA